ncbi:UbiX family flavin prenyltransferase [Desulfolutivibrio sulfoxidireducens]|uniref:UbiX family flavin prenyltransferase n=1 Tax=Desulfolutivibrio sulfoxidireducens TaxID=2773299 RepID=UPI00159E5D4B|nr:UbiX family flavin prenyltransferase [Desulfolutivibrio sulfoxidireducens]QLA19778.1 UbiX family flavin prenyltransferase [Desulfolutivibrio sulfoxidireducens]
MNDVKRLIVGISGASCANLAVMLLSSMRQMPGWETHLVLSDGARRTIEHETPLTGAQVEAMATASYATDDVGATIASGTFVTAGMVVVPCSMKTLAGIAHGYSDNLLLRAADVVLKERRKLVLAVRETPLNLIHLHNMVTLASMGVVVMPPVLTFYNHPQTLEDVQRHIVGKLLHEFGVELPGFKRWNGQKC